MIHRRLFWKIYLTLLASLVVVAVLMGGLWFLLGESPRDRLEQARTHLTDTLQTTPDDPTAMEAALKGLCKDVSADISVYTKESVLIASVGEPFSFPHAKLPRPHPQHVFMRIDLPDGRIVLVRLKPPPGARVMHILFAMLVVAGSVGFAAFPITARLTRQLEGLRSGMARWGQGDLWARVDDSGADEVASVGRTFNAAAERINVLLTAQKALLANASHELRSPLARLRLSVDLWQERPAPATREEMVRNLAELDELVEEILLSSRLDHPSSTLGRTEVVDLLGLAAEEAARSGAMVEGEPIEVRGNETLLRRLIRNLLENAVKHGRAPVVARVATEDGRPVIAVSDAGEGLPADERERVFEPFYRPAGRAESGGGWGLGLSLVRQIAGRHGAVASCETEPGGGNRFVVRFGPPADPEPTEKPKPAAPLSFVEPRQASV